MRGSILLFLTALLCTPAASQAGAGGERAFQLLLERRAELDLSPQQVQRLQAIEARLAEANRPLRERLAAERTRFLGRRRAELEQMTPRERRAELRRLRRHPPPLPPAMAAIAEEMRRNLREAVLAASNVLTLEQRDRVRHLLREERLRARAAP